MSSKSNRTNEWMVIWYIFDSHYAYRDCFHTFHSLWLNQWYNRHIIYLYDRRLGIQPGTSSAISV